MINKYIFRQKIYDDDIFIASFPKSGNTWMRFILSHLLTNCEEQLNFTNFDKYIPEINVHRKLVKKLNRPRLLKTHSMYYGEIKKAIYIIRDPRDVYVSYYHHLKKRLPGSWNLHKFIDKYINKKNSWGNHYESWNKLQNKIIVKYEDLHRNPNKEISKVVDFLNINKNVFLIKQAIEYSSFERLSKIEVVHGRKFLSEKDKSKASKFMRKGQIGSWKAELDDEDIQKIEKLFRKQMIELEYQFSRTGNDFQH